MSKFQSLFFWILYLNQNLPPLKYQIIHVSILILLDSLLKLMFSCHNIGRVLKFQSLFFWILYLNL